MVTNGLYWDWASKYQKHTETTFKIIRVVLCRKLPKNTLNIRKMTRHWKVVKLAILQGRYSGKVVKKGLFWVGTLKSKNIQKTTPIILQLFYTKIGKIPPDYPSLRVSTPSKSHATLLIPYRKRASERYRIKNVSNHQVEVQEKRW